jgi:hypothetical protein
MGEPSAPPAQAIPRLGGHATPYFVWYYLKHFDLWFAQLQKVYRSAYLRIHFQNSTHLSLQLRIKFHF